MQEVRISPEFTAWRVKARELLSREIDPTRVIWKSSRDEQDELAGLFSQTGGHGSSDGAEVRLDRDPTEEPASAPRPAYSVPASFVSEAKYVAAHRDAKRWALLYRLLWRITHGEPELMRIAVDPDVANFHSMYRSVKRDLHKMKAFVRFRETKDVETPGPDGAHFVAWYEPDHPIVKLAAPFFAERFNGMSWTILTPDDCAHWDRKRVSYSPGCPKSLAPRADDTEALWKTYYASIFNPARIKTRAMKKELPVRYWKNLPETELIPGLIQSAPARLQHFYDNQPKRAEQWMPKLPPGQRQTLAQLRDSAAHCRACGICENAKQTVWGEGPSDARVLVIGEQPGDQEDRIGRPFQGPAGQLLDRAFADAGIDRSSIYLTNAVKHFKWKPQGKIRLHQRPSSAEIAACRPWLAAEIATLQPELVICLGVTAAQAVFGKSVTLKELRGAIHSTGACERTIVTTHPAAILRADGAIQDDEYVKFVADLRAAYF